jgi:hypothetical protein
MKKTLVYLALCLFVFSSSVSADDSRFGKLLSEFPGYSPFGRLVHSTKKVVREKILGVKTKQIREKETIRVAVLGDSMVDVLGPGIPYLEDKLETYFFAHDFDVYNCGVGATNIKYGLERLTNSYEYKGAEFPAVLSLQPDILVIESFAYNNFGYGQEGLDKQWMYLARIVDKVKEESPSTQIILASTIGPNSKIYGDGISGIHWNQAQKLIKAETVRKYLDNAVKFAESEGYSVANVFEVSTDIAGEGRPIYINPDDNLHPSNSGKELFCDQVFKEIKKIVIN